jgi:hypothetical protein
VLDEEAWLDAVVKALMPGAVAQFRVPLEGPAAWVDALNLYRYGQDISGFGKHLKETKLKGWHRHYRPEELTDLFQHHGLEVVEITREGNPLLEVGQLAALVWGGMIRKTTEVEDSVRSWREGREDYQRLSQFGPFSTRLTVTTRKPD